jgi:hypothetical protein|tara:strand:- start:21946 stop:22425 length:480 start_codon:yes stop_codon:yes gene_type:complete
MNETILDDSVSGSTTGFTEKIKEYLAIIGKWAKFFSILGFIGMGFMLLAGLAFLLFGSLPMVDSLGGSSVSGYGNMTFMPKLMGFIYIIMAVLYYFPVLYMYNFAIKIKVALASNSQHEYEIAFENLKKHFKFVGLVTVVILSIYALIFVLGLLAAIIS